MYKALHENCQTFCMRLLECIRTPRDLCDIFEGLECVPQGLSHDILVQRCKEFNRTPTVGNIRVIASLEPLPLSIGTIYRLSAVVVPAMTIAIFLRSLVVTLVFLVVGCLYAGYSHTAPLKPLSPFLWRPPRQDKICLMVYRQLFPDEANNEKHD